MIRTVDLGDDDDLDAVYEIGVAARAFRRPHFSPSARESLGPAMRAVDDEEPAEHYLVERDGEYCAAVALSYPQTTNADTVWVQAHLHPDRTGRGAATELIEFARSRAQATRRSRLLLEFPIGTGYEHPAIDLLARHGATVESTVAVRRVVLPIPAATIRTESDATGSAANASYRIETHRAGLSRGAVPDAMLPGVADLLALVDVDAPSGGVDFEPELITADRLRGWDEQERARGAGRNYAVAIERGSGAVVAVSVIYVPATPADRAFQLATYVHREHRGHRLGMAVKLANLEAFAADEPGRSMIFTGNSDQNEHMIAINRRLGFEQVETEVLVRMLV